MSSAGSGAVFFLGTRAHYQVLQQPEQPYDQQNGNSTETIYQNPSTQELWPEEANSNYINERNWNYYDNDVNTADERENQDLRNSKRRQSETKLCERDNDMRPALLNNVTDSASSKPKTRGRISVLSLMASLARRRRRLEAAQVRKMQTLRGALVTCTYRESCRCLDCQSRYFECDESDEYSSEDSEFDYPKYLVPAPAPVLQYDEDEDDEVFMETAPDDNTSRDMLLEAKGPPSAHASASASASSCAEDDADMQLEVAAGTPVLLNYLLTHPVTCAIQ